jgi:hypothetical protein
VRWLFSFNTFNCLHVPLDVLVVNITWRGKTYVGALLNTTEEHWAPTRYVSYLLAMIISKKSKHCRCIFCLSTCCWFMSSYRMHRRSTRSSRNYRIDSISSTDNQISSSERRLRNGKRRDNVKKTGSILERSRTMHQSATSIDQETLSSGNIMSDNDTCLSSHLASEIRYPIVSIFDY